MREREREDGLSQRTEYEEGSVIKGERGTKGDLYWFGIMLT